MQNLFLVDCIVFLYQHGQQVSPRIDEVSVRSPAQQLPKVQSPVRTIPVSIALCLCKPIPFIGTMARFSRLWSSKCGAA